MAANNNVIMVSTHMTRNLHLHPLDSLSNTAPLLLPEPFSTRLPVLDLPLSNLQKCSDALNNVQIGGTKRKRQDTRDKRDESSVVETLAWWRAAWQAFMYLQGDFMSWSQVSLAFIRQLHPRRVQVPRQHACCVLDFSHIRLAECSNLERVLERIQEIRMEEEYGRDTMVDGGCSSSYIYGILLLKKVMTGHRMRQRWRNTLDRSWDVICELFSCEPSCTFTDKLCRGNVV